MYYMSYIWIAVLIISIVVEIATVELTSFWFAFGAFASLIISLFQIPKYGIYIEIAAFFIISALAIIFLKPIFKRKFDTPIIATNVSSMIDKICVVEEEVSENKTGSIRYEGIVWSAKSNENFNPGDFAKIVKVEGNTLFITKYKKEEE